MKAKLISQNGNIKIKINNETLAPQCFRSFRPDADSIRNFAAAGIRLMNVFPTGIINKLGTPYSPFGEVWIGEKEYNWENLRHQMDLFTKNAPDAYFMLMMHLDTRDWFLEENPDVEDSFNNFSLTAGCEKWRKSASRFLCDTLSYLDVHYPEKIYGVMLCAGGTNEWYTNHEYYARHGKYKQEAFKNWKGDNTCELPPKKTIDKTSWGILRHPVDDAQGLEYWRFLHELTTDTIKHFAGTVKKHTGGNLLTAVAQGYLMDYKNDVLSDGSCGLWETLDCNDIDIFIAPASYWFRKFDSTSGIRYPVDSIKLHKKLYLHSLDNTTHLVNHMKVAQRLQNGFCSHVRLSNLDESKEYFKRETSLVLSKGMGYWWFGMYPEWHNDSDMMSEIKKIQEVSNIARQKDCSSVSEIGVFVDQDSNYYLDAGQIVTNKNVWLHPETLHRLGAPWDNFHMKDICNSDMPHEQYKLYIFLNLIAPEKKLREMIAKLRREGKSMLFIYAPGIISGNAFSIEAMNELSGIKLKEMKEPEHIATVRKGKWNTSSADFAFGYDAPVKPMFYADDTDAEAIGYFEKSGKAALVLKERSSGFDAWAAGGPIPPEILRKMAKKAGVKIYLETDDPLFVNKSLIGCFAHKPGIRTFKMPSECKIYELFSKKEFKTEGKTAQVAFKGNEMKLFEIISNKR